MRRHILYAAIGLSAVTVAAIDFYTSADFVGSILFTLPLGLCALQPSRRVLLSTAAFVVTGTIVAGYWGFHRAGIGMSGDGSLNRGLLVASLGTLAAFIDIGMGNVRKQVREAGEIERQRGSLATQNAELALLATASSNELAARQLSADELARSAARYRGLLEAAPDAMVVSDANGHILLVNAETERMFGYTRAELVGATVEVLVPERFRAKHPMHRSQYATHPRVRSMGDGQKLSGLRKDGTEFPVEIILSSTEMPDGALITSAIRDATSRKIAEETLSASEERFRLLVNGVEDYAIFTLDPAGRVASWNAGAERLKGYRADEILGAFISKFYSPDDVAAGKPEAELALAATEGRSEDEGWRQRKDGTRFWAHVIITALRDESGALRGYGKLTRDVTAHMLAEEKLRVTEERHRMAVDVAEMGTWVWKIGPDEITWSDEFRTLFGLPSDATLTYDQITAHIHVDDRERLSEAVMQTLEHGQPYDIEYRIIWPDTSIHWIASRGRVTRAPDGTPVDMEGVVMDVTERKLAQEAILNLEAERRRADELLRSNSDLQQFAYVAAHDLQEPLRMVASYTQLLGQRYTGRLDSDADEFIAYAVDGAHRMQVLIADLLAYCRVGTTGKDFQSTSTEIVLGEARENLRGAIEDSGATVTHDEMPSIVADHSQLVQLFQNLVGNAIKYRTSEPPRVHISAQRGAPNEWIFAVRDNGIGIDPKYADKIFLMFQRLHGRDEFSGTGIGLTICKKIAERHGGRIWVEPNVGAGSTFHVALAEGPPS